MKKYLFLVLLSVTVFANTTAKENKEDKIAELTDRNYRAETASGIMLVDFWAPWCVPCLKQAPVLKELSSDTSLTIKIAKLDIGKYKTLAIEQGIKSIPTMILYKDGKEITRFIGLYERDMLKEGILSALAQAEK